MDQTLAELHQKVDALAREVSYLSEQARLAERQRQDRAELMRDLTPVAHHAFRLTMEQLEEIQDHVELSDLLRLFKRLLRNGRNLERMLDQLEGLVDLADTLGPLADEVFAKSVEALAEMERKGYFAVARGGMQVADRVVSVLSDEDMHRLGESAGLLVGLLKDLARPELVNFFGGVLRTAKQEVKEPPDTSLLGLLRQMRDPGVRRGLALTLRVLRAVGAQAESRN